MVTQLREEIFNGRRLPGSDLRELTIARDLNVSQATVREAHYRLEHAGLVTRKPHVGTTVTRLSPKDLRERVALRAILECLAAEAAAPRMSEADFEELDRRLKVLSAGIETDNYYETAQADLDFHRYIWKCSGNETLCLLLELVTVPLFAFISIMRSHGLQRLTTVVASHTPLVAALRSRDSGQIRGAFEKGATSSYESFLGEQSELTLAEAFGFLQFGRGQA
ncbi:MAG TPA: GntR family transcriptional regulator [Bryobacteraceae bacterium]|nr:GntR family transcriptional regulator [Bryobacteraceae bacterium]